MMTDCRTLYRNEKTFPQYSVLTKRFIKIYMHIKHLKNNLTYLIVEHYMKYQFSQSGTAKIENMSL